MFIRESTTRGDSWSVSDMWFRFRNRVLSDARFQRWAARFPLTRFIAKRRATALFDLCAGFVYSQVLHASVKLGLMEALAKEPLTLSEIARAIGLSMNAARRLVDAATALKLVQRRRNDTYGLGIHGAAYMGNRAIAAMVEHHALFYRDLADPVALLQGAPVSTELHQFWSYTDHAAHSAVASTDADVAAYSRLMAASVSLLAEDVIEAYPQAENRCLLDVGGGEGAFLEAVAARSPHLALMLFDLPAVAARASARIANAGFAERTTVHAGDVFHDPLPKGADVISLVRVIHDHDDDRALDILRAVLRALPPGGTLLLAEPMSGSRGGERVGDAYFGFYLLAMGQGRARTPERLRALLLESGFEDVQQKKTRREMLSQLLVARAPGQS